MQTLAKLPIIAPNRKRIVDIRGDIPEFNSLRRRSSDHASMLQS